MLFAFAATLLHRLSFELSEKVEKPNGEAPSIASIGIVSTPTDFKVIARKRHDKRINAVIP